MDDTNSRQQLEELADLYLTGITDDAEQQADDPVAETLEGLEGPAPIRLSPKLEPTDTTEIEVEEPEDRHPVLRLTEQEAEEETATQDINEVTMQASAPIDEQVETGPPPRAVVEAVLLGNLPGMSGPWLTQYAQLLAQSEGPVALLHVTDDGIDLELVEPRAEAEPLPTQPMSPVRIPPMRGNKTGLVGLLDAMASSDTTPVNTILVRLETATDALTLSRLAAMEDWTLLCGSDESSVAAAVQQLRGVVRADPRLADRNVGVMVMGSNEEISRGAAKNIGSDLEHDLAHPVEFLGHLKRMQPVQVREIGSFPDTLSLWPQFVSWLETVEAPEPKAQIEAATPEPITPAPAAQAPKPTPSATASSPAPQPMFRQAAPTPPPPRAATRPAESTTATSAPSMGQAPARPVVASAPTRPAPSPRVIAPKAELDLIALVGQGSAALDNPAVLDARIPDQPQTQLAVDGQGVVHILAQHESNALDTSQAVMQLIEAGRWISENLELIALTQRDRQFVDQEPVLHLLTDQADQSTRLVAKLAGQIRLHLLQQVQIGRDTGWFCTPLS